MTALRRSVDIWGVIAFGLGTAVGVAIFSAVAPATAAGGPAMLLAVALAAVPMFVIALNYAFIGSVLPVSGASFEWPSRFLHPAAGFFIAWLRIAGTTGAMVVLALVFTRYLSMALPVPTKPAMAALFTLMMLANLLGVGISSTVQKVMMALLLVVLAIFIAWGATRIEPANFHPFFSHGSAGMLAALPLLIGLFFGIEAATELGDEITDTRRTIPLGIAISLGAAVLLYALISAVAIGVAGAAPIAGSETPLLYAAGRFMGPFALPLIVTAGVLAIGKSLNAQFMIFSRSLYAMALAGMLPELLTRVHPRWQTPYVAILAVYLLCLAGLLLPSSLTFLFLAVNIPTLLKYASISASADRIVVAHAPLYARAAFRLPRRWARIAAWAGVAGAIAIILLGITADWHPYAALAAWGAIGIPVYFLRDRAMQRRWADAALRTGPAVANAA